jgi:hypothetical protein
LRIRDTFHKTEKYHYPCWNHTSRGRNGHTSCKYGVHPVQIRPRIRIVCPRLHLTLLLAHIEHKTTKLALFGPTWLVAMQVEYDALIDNDTWYFVPFSPW